MNRRIILAWSFVAGVSVLDVVILHLYINRPDMEINPIASWVHRQGGIGAVILLRIIALGYVYLISRLNYPTAKFVLPFLLGVYFELLLTLLNVLFQVLR